MWLPHPHPVGSAPRPPSLGWRVAVGVLCGGWVLALVIHPAYQQFPGPFAEGPEIPPLEVPLEAGVRIDLGRATDLLVEAVVQLESQGDASKIGSLGERGLMQIREATWREVTRRHYGRGTPFDQAFDPERNRAVGRLYLGDLQEFLYRHRSRWRADLRSLLLAAYNAGPERVKRGGFSLERLPETTRDYVRRGVALHDWLLADEAEGLRELLRGRRGGE